MAATKRTTTKPPKPNTEEITTATKHLACFSFAAYAKSLINHLIASSHIPIERGLTDSELTAIETTYHFTFPTDLRAILQEGLPVGPAFPNWRSSSAQQLCLLLRLPSLSLLRQVSDGPLWRQSWGPKPPLDDLANQLLKNAPVLVPIYRNCYVPSTPSLAGNPVFYIDAESVRVVSSDVTRFFCHEFGFVHVPAWAPKEARWIEFWSEVVAELGRGRATRGETRGWWTGEAELAGCLEEVFWRLREGGWEEEEVREMMMMDGYNGKMRSGPRLIEDGEDEAGVRWRVRVLSMVLMRGGWARDDVVDSLGLEDQSECLRVVDFLLNDE